MAKPEQSPSEEGRAVEETLRDPGSGASSRGGSRKGGSRRGSRKAASRGGSQTPSRRSGQRQTRRHRVGGRRHPDIEVARLLVKRGYVEKPAAVEALKLQKRRAKQGKKRIPYLQLLVKQRHVEAALERSRADAAIVIPRRQPHLAALLRERWGSPPPVAPAGAVALELFRVPR